MRREFPEADPVHGAQRVEHGIEHDLRHAHAFEILNDRGVQGRRTEVLDDGALHRIAFGRMAVVCAQVHRLGMGIAREVEVARAVHVRADERCSPVDTVCGEIPVEPLEVPMAVHCGEHGLVAAEQRRTPFEQPRQLMLFDEHDPHIGVAGVFLRVVDVDGHQMAVLAILRNIRAVLGADRLDVLTPAIDEVHIAPSVLLQEHAELYAHATCADYRIPHSSPILCVPSEGPARSGRPRQLTMYGTCGGDITAWLYEELIQCGSPEAAQALTTTQQNGRVQ